MPHLDEGTLHAFLDGALPDSTAEVAEAQSSRETQTQRSQERQLLHTRHEVEQHLSECAACRAALEDARRIRETSANILSSVGPNDVVMPSFEDLQARAKAVGSAPDQRASKGAELQRSRLPQMRALAWAATVVLAAAVGWYARSAVLTSRQDQLGAESETEGRLAISVPQTPSEKTEADSETTGGRSQPQPRGVMEEGSQVLDVGGVSVAAAEQAETATGHGADLTPRADAPESTPETRETVEEPVPQPVDLSNLVRVDSGERIARTVSQPEQRARIESPQARQVAAVGAAPAPAVTRAAGERGLGAEMGWAEVDETAAAAVLQEPVPRIDGLSVIDYATTWLAGQQAVRIRQVLDSGGLVELIVVSANSEETAAEDKKGVDPTEGLTDADVGAANSVVVMRGSLTIRLLAPVSTDSLYTLGEKIPSG